MRSEAERSISGDAASEAKLKVDEGLKRCTCARTTIAIQEGLPKDRALESLGR
jgi:hypothetical protein